MTTPTTLPEALTEIEGLRGQVRELLRLLGQEAPLNTGAAGLPTSEIAGLNGMPEISLAQVSLERKQTGRERTQIVAEGCNVIEIAPDIIFKLDLHGNLAGWNKRLETVTGFVPEELNSRPAVSFAPECEREQAAAAIRQAFEQGYTELEGHLLTKTGRMIPYHWTGATLENHLGHVIGLIGVGRDRTVLKHAEEALRTSEARFRELVETTTDWMWEINELGAYTYCSPKIREFLGYEPDEAIGKTPFDFMPPEEAHRVAALFGPIAAARKPFAGIENINRRKDGQLVTFECRGIPIFGADGSFRGYRGFDQDVTRRKLFELQNRERLDSMIRFQEIQLHLHRQPFQDLTEGLRTILRMAANAVSIERVGIWLFSDDHSSLICRELYQLSLNKYESGAVLDASHYPRYFDALDQSLPLAVNDVLTDPRTSEFTEDYFIPLGISSVMDVAVRRDGAIIGVVWFEHTGLKTEWSEEEQAFARSIGDHVALCLLDAERQQTDMALRESEARFAAAVEGSTDVLWDAQRIPGVPWHAPETPIWWSPRMRQFLGLEDGESFDTLGQWVARLHPDDRNHVLGRLTAHIEQRVPYDTEYRLRTNQGEYRWMRGKGQAIWDEQGEPCRMSGSSQDITDRKQAEAALRASEEQFQSLVDNIPGAVYRCAADEQWTMAYLSDAIEDLIGYPSSDFLNNQVRSYASVIHPDDRRLVEDVVQAGLDKNEPYQLEYRLLHCDGTIRWVYERGQGVFSSDGTLCYCDGAIFDITERKRAEQLLETERQVLALMATAQPLTDTLTLLCEGCESIGQGMLVSVLLRDQDGQHLRHGAAPSLPDAYNRAIDGIAIGPLVGSCGTAAYFGRQVIVTDIATDPLWEQYCELALSHGLRSCWATPIVSKDGQVLGTFAAYYRTPREPRQADLELMDRMTHLACLAIGRTQAEQSLKTSEEKLRQSLLASNTGLWDWNTETGEVFFSKEWKSQLGYLETELPDTFESWESRLHPDDRVRAVAFALDYVNNPAGVFRQDFRLLHKDGTYRWIDSHASLVTESDGRRVRLVGSHTDITERKQTEAALHAVEARQRALLKSTPAMIYSCTVTDEFSATFVSENVVDLLGYRPQDFLDDPHFWINHIHPDDRARVLAELAPILETDHHVHEYRFLRRDGTYCWLHDELRLIRNEAGIPQELIGYQIDITDRKRVEMEVVASKKQLQDILDTIFGFVTLLTVEGRIIEMNRVALETVGASKADVLNQYLWEGPWFIRLPDMQSRSQEWIGRAAQGEVVQGELEFRVSSGELAVAETTFGPLRDASGAIIGVVGFGVNITDRKRAEAALQESESHFRAMIENSSDIITVLDLDGTIRFESPSFERLLGYAQHEIDGRIAFDFIHPDDLPAVIEKFQRIVQRPGETQTAEFRFRHQDGSWLSLEGVGRATCDARSRSCVIVNSRDITERKRAERLLLQTRDLLTSFVENVPAAVAMLDRELRYVAVSRRWLTDYRLGDEPLVGRRHYDVFPEIQDMKEWQEIHQRCLSGSVERCEEDRLVRADGSEDWLRWEVRPWHDVTGEIGGIIIFTEVITARKQAEAALRVSEERLALAVEGSTDILWDTHRLPGEPWYTPQTPIWWSPRVRGLLDLEESELFETLEQWAMRLHPDDKDGVFGKLAAHIERRVPYDAEYRLRTNRGDYLWIRARGQAIWDEQGEVRRMSGSCQDITERKRVEEERQKQEILISLMFNTGPACITLVAADGTLLHMNPTGLNMVEACGESEVVGGSVYSLVTPAHRDAFISMHRSVIEGHARTLQFEIQGLKGTRRWMESYAVPFRNPVTGQTEKLAVAHDITERAQAEEALRRSEARLKEAQRIAHVGSWELDLVANRLTWSDEIYRIFEIDAEAFGASYEAFLQLVHPDDRSLVDRAYTESVTFRTPYNITHRLLMADGRIKFVREQCETQYGRDGLALRSSGTVQDITKQKEAEEALAQKHSLLTAIMDASIDLISIKDLQGRYVHINRAGADAVGMPAEAVIGWDDLALWGGELAAFRRTSDRFVTESGQTITVEEQGTLLGNIAHYLTTKAPYRDSEGSIIGVIGIARNITEWKRVEEDRQKALTLLINVINATPDLIFVKDRDLRTLLCNNAFAQAIGKTPEDLIGRSDIGNGWDPELVKGNSDEGFPGYESDDRQALAGKAVHNPSDPVNVNGEVRIFDTYKVPLRDDTGGVIGILGVSRDVTERKRMEEILRQRERDLRAAVEERERISEDLHDGILQSIFAVGLGLESCRTLVSELPLPRKKATAPLLATLNRAIGQLNHVMAEVRNFIAGIESHVLQGGDVGSTLGAMVQSMCASNGTAWRVSIEEAAVRELSTEQAYHVMNIVREALSNSLRHSGAGRIALSLTRLRRSVRLSVTDNGKGFIPDSVRDVGHGLINMAARARKLGGQLEVRSRPRQGTKVLLDLPRRSVDE